MEFVADRPGAVFVILYAAAFLGANMAMDVLTMVVPSVDASVFRKYVFPFVIVWPFWLGLKSNSKRFILQQRADARVCQEPPCL
jgi:hypothetical protein